MKKNILLTMLLLCGLTTWMSAQSVDEVAVAAGELLCDCVNDTYGQIDDDVKVAIMTIFSYQMESKEQEMERYLNSMSADLGGRLQQQIGLLEGDNELFERCVENVEQELVEYAAHSNAPEVSEDEFTLILMEKMKKDKACEFAYFLMGVTLLEAANEAAENQQKGNTAASSTSTTKKTVSKEYHGTGGN